MKRYIYITFVFALILASCNKIDTQEKNNNFLDISIKNVSCTRSVIEGTTLPSGSEVGIFVVDDTGRTYDANTIANVKYTATGENELQVWNTSSNIMLSQTKATVNSYYPHNESVTDITAIPIEATSEVQKDWMWGTPVSNLDNTNNYATITMNHALAAVKLNIVKSNYPNEGKVTSVSFKSTGAASHATMNAKTGKLSNITNSGYCFDFSREFILSNTYSVSFVAVPTNTAAPLTISMIIDGKEMNVQTADVTLLPGNIYECNLSLNISELLLTKLNVTEWTIEKMGEMELNPYYPVVNITGTKTYIKNIEHDYKNKTLTVKAYPYHAGHTIKEVSVKGGIDTQSIDENGVRTIVITDIVSDVTVTFAGTTFVPWARIQHVDGTLYTAEEWIAAEEAGTVTDADANGVAVLYSEYAICPHVIHPQRSEQSMYWGDDIPDLSYCSNSDKEYDINGKLNTEIILNAVATYNKFAPAAQYCAEVTFANGQQGYLPAAGELRAWIHNINAINNCMDAIGGVIIDTANCWSSTQYLSTHAYYGSSDGIGGINAWGYKTEDYLARPVTSFSY